MSSTLNGMQRLREAGVPLVVEPVEGAATTVELLAHLEREIAGRLTSMVVGVPLRAAPGDVQSMREAMELGERLADEQASRREACLDIPLAPRVEAKAGSRARRLAEARRVIADRKAVRS
jgi:hypothetical protein